MNITHDGATTQNPVVPANRKFKRTIDLTGQIFGKLTVIEVAERKPESTQRGAVWLCKCECGKTKIVRAGSLKAGTSMSCGCMSIKRLYEYHGKTTLTHGMSKTWQNGTLSSIIQRCTDKNCAAYKDYGGRGISFDPRWREDHQNFFNDIASLGPRPPGWSIDRIDGSGDYILGNIRWASSKTQNRNKRNNVNIEFNGQTKCISEWASEIGIPPGTLWWRICEKGWTIERALTERLRQTKPSSEWVRSVQ